MSKPEKDERDRLQEKVDDLTELVGVLAAAVSKVSKSQVLLSETVANVVDTQATLVTAVDNTTSRLDEISGGVEELLRRLPAPSQSEDD